MVKITLKSLVHMLNREFHSGFPIINCNFVLKKDNNLIGNIIGISTMELKTLIVECTAYEIDAGRKEAKKLTKKREHFCKGY